MKPKLDRINHITLVVRDLAEARAFYEKELHLEPLPTFKFDYPAQFYRLNESQQLHLTEWKDIYSFRGHACFTTSDFNGIFHRMSELGRIDVSPWGKIRRLPDGAFQMFIRDPSGNLLEISAAPDYPIDPSILTHPELAQLDGNLYVSGRNDARGDQAENATLYYR